MASLKTSSCFFYSGKAVTAVGMPCFYWAGFPRAVREVRLTCLWPCCVLDEVADREVWPVASPWRVPWPHTGCILPMCCIFKDLELTKNSILLCKRSYSGFEKTLQALLYSCLNNIKPFCNPSQEYVMSWSWGFSYVWRSALHLFSAFSSKLLLIPTIKKTPNPQFLHKEDLSLYSLFLKETTP